MKKILLSIIFSATVVTFYSGCYALRPKTYGTLIEKKYDEFTGKTEFKSPLDDNHLRFQKIVGNTKKVTLYLSIYMKIESSDYDARGIIILFEDGTKINFENQLHNITCSYISSGLFLLGGFCELTDTDLNQLQHKKVKGIKMDIYEIYITSEEATAIQTNANLIDRAY